MADKTRVHILAKELSVTSKTILEKCRAEGLTVKNHMSTLTAGQEATLREWFSEGAHETTVEVADRVNLAKVRTKLRKRKTKKDAVLATVEAAAPADMGLVAVGEASVTVEAEAPVEVPPAADLRDAGLPVGEPAVEKPIEGEEAPTAAEVAAEAPLEAAVSEAAGEPPAQESVVPVGPQNVPKPARLRGPRVVRYEALETSTYPARRQRRRALDAPGEAVAQAPAVGAPVSRVPARRKDESKPAAKQRTHGRRRGGDLEKAGEKIREWRDRDMIERRERLAGATGRRIHTHRLEMKRGVPSVPTAAVRKTEAEIQEPIVLKEFCSVIGVPFLQVFRVLERDHHKICTINSVIDKETAELVAVEFGIVLTVAEAKTSLDVLKEEFAERQRPRLQSRSPVVAMLGHVDHGKTSLLDAIRRAHVTEGEDGGITQHIGAYRVETPVGPLTFVDTPGHEAFTAMRARGANLTDIVVLVVAADDGVMPQTVEAINHAMAAEVPIVVALNKTDLGRDKEVEIYGQLASNGLTPGGDWGGQTDVIATSAVTGEGIRDLLDHLVALGDVMDLQADPTVDACATVIEAETKGGVGPVVRVLVREGTLQKGDIVVCGNAAGKVRALHDDKGRLIPSVGPSTPVEVWGLEDVPMAGDTLYQVDSMQRAKAIATEVAQRRQDEARSDSRRAQSLEDLFRRRGEDELSELNVIVKADVDGSVGVLRHSLGQLPSDKVRLHIRHAGVGAVNDSDIVLAEASDAIIIAFRVAVQPGAKKKAESKQVDLRYYRVVYEVVDDIIKAMEGKLAPIEQFEPRATAEVREIFKITKVGLVAGCMVTNGTVARNHRLRVVRDGAVIREGCEIESLRHFKEDVKEVRAGMECGIRLVRFNDLKPSDVIETYEVVEIARTL